jgi:predicted DNA-binding transcriptional regulator YafY
VTLQAPIEMVAKRVPASAGVLEAIDGQSCMLNTGSHSLEGITIHVSVLGVDFVVHEPPELIEYVRRLSDRLGRAVL